jgi:hypothetical protein
MGRIEDWMVTEEGLTVTRGFARRVAALRSPAPLCAQQLEERAEAKIMSSGDLDVV